MTIEKCEGCPKLEKARKNSGRLDKLIRTVTLGKFALETTIETGLIDSYSGELFHGDPTIRALKTGKPVVVLDMGDCVHTQRKIVRVE